FCSSRRRHTRFSRDWSSDVCSSDLPLELACAVEDLIVGLELLAADAVQRLVLTGVDVSAVVEGLEEDLHAALMALLRGADEVVRSEERRVGKEWRPGWSLYTYATDL